MPEDDPPTIIKTLLDEAITRRKIERKNAVA